MSTQDDKHENPDRSKFRQYPSLDLIYEFANDRIKHLHDVFKAQDTKAGIFIAVVNIVASVTFFFTTRDAVQPNLKPYLGLVLFVVIILAAFALGFCLVALMVRTYNDPANIRAFRENYLQKSPADTKDQILANLDELQTRLTDITNIKAKHLKNASHLLFPIVFFAIIAGGINAYSIYSFSNAEIVMSKDKGTKPSGTSGKNPGKPDSSSNATKPQLTKPDPKLNVPFKKSLDGDLQKR